MRNLVRLHNTNSNPFFIFDSMDRVIDHNFDLLESGSNNNKYYYQHGGSSDVEEKDNYYLISMDMPGVTQEDIQITLSEEKLSIVSERKDPYGERYAKYSKSFSLPEYVKEDEIQANFENGVLRIAVPKKEKPEPKKIAFNSDKGFWNKFLTHN